MRIERATEATDELVETIRTLLPQNIGPQTTSSDPCLTRGVRNTGGTYRGHQTYTFVGLRTKPSRL